MRDNELAADPSDAELVARVRVGDRRALAALYERHRAEALHIARLVTRDHDAEELATEAFVRVLDQIDRGGGPTDSFRAYLHTVIRNLHRERLRRSRREQAASDKPWLLETAHEQDDDEVDEVDAARAARALRSLPANWRQLLWELEVQGRKPADVAAELSVSAATVSSTAYRAREGLRLAYLDEHVPLNENRHCAWARPRLSRLARGSLTTRSASRVRRHLDDCAACAAIYDDLHQLNSRLGLAIWPIVLVGGAAIPGALATPPSEPQGQSGSTGSGLRTSMRQAVGSPVRKTVAAVAAAAVVVATAAAGLTLTGGEAPTSSPSSDTRDDGSGPPLAVPPRDDAVVQPTIAEKTTIVRATSPLPTTAVPPTGLLAVDTDDVVATVPPEPPTEPVSPPAPTPSLPTGLLGELVLNGGADDGTNGWTGPLLVQSYSTGGYPDPVILTDPVGTIPDAGTTFFTGSGAESTATQTIDLSAGADAIDSGTVTADMSAYLGGYAGQVDRAEVTFAFADATGTLLRTVNLPFVTAADRTNVSGFLLRADSIQLDPGTRQVTITVHAVRGIGTSNDGYVDAISLQLSQ